MQFTIRPWHLNDLESLVENANNPNIAKFMTDGFPILIYQKMEGHLLPLPQKTTQYIFSLLI